MKNRLLQNSPSANVLINATLGIFSVLCLIPLVMILSISFSNETDILKSGFRIIPLHVDTRAYWFIFKSPATILNAYKITGLVTVVGTLTSLLLTSMLAYTISRRDFKYRNAISFFLFFTMLFSGGLVPWYILISRYLKLTDTIPVLILPSLVSAWNVFLMRTYFQKIPVSLVESAKIDGASELKTFLKIVMPISKPSFATIGLFIAMGYWNDWYLSLLFINKPKLFSLQMLLSNMLTSIDAIKSQMLRQMSGGIAQSAARNIPTESMRMAMCIVAIGPIMVVFPFLQKYFVQGLTVGAIKG